MFPHLYISFRLLHRRIELHIKAKQRERGRSYERHRKYDHYFSIFDNDDEEDFGITLPSSSSSSPSSLSSKRSGRSSGLFRTFTAPAALATKPTIEEAELVSRDMRNRADSYSSPPASPVRSCEMIRRTDQMLEKKRPSFSKEVLYKQAVIGRRDRAESYGDLFEGMAMSIDPACTPSPSSSSSDSSSSSHVHLQESTSHVKEVYNSNTSARKVPRRKTPASTASGVDSFEEALITRVFTALYKNNRPRSASVVSLTSENMNSMRNEDMSCLKEEEESGEDEYKDFDEKCFREKNIPSAKYKPSELSISQHSEPSSAPADATLFIPVEFNWFRRVFHPFLRRTRNQRRIVSHQPHLSSTASSDDKLAKPATPSIPSVSRLSMLYLFQYKCNNLLLYFRLSLRCSELPRLLRVIPWTRPRP